MLARRGGALRLTAGWQRPAARPLRRLLRQLLAPPRCPRVLPWRLELWSQALAAPQLGLAAADA